MHWIIRMNMHYKGRDCILAHLCILDPYFLSLETQSFNLDFSFGVRQKLAWIPWNYVLYTDVSIVIRYYSKPEKYFPVLFSVINALETINFN